MIWVDFFIIGLTIICVITGLFRGFGGEVFASLNWVVAVFVALSFDKYFVRFVPEIYSHPTAQIAAAFIALLLMTLALGAVIGVLLGALASNVGVSFFARLGGMTVGVFRSMIIIIILVMLTGLTSLPNDSWWQESKLLPPFQLLAVGLRDHVPSGIAEYVKYH